MKLNLCAVSQFFRHRKELRGAMAYFVNPSLVLGYALSHKLRQLNV